MYYYIYTNIHIKLLTIYTHKSIYIKAMNNETKMNTKFIF